MKKLLFLLILSYCCSVFAMVVEKIKPVTCDEKGHCEGKWQDCTKEKPLKDKYGGSCVSCDYAGGLLGGTIQVNSSSECSVCPNRKTLKNKEEYYCVLKDAPKNRPLVLKLGYQSCGYCVKENDIVDCSKCLDDYDIINGKCKRKTGRACFQA